MTANVYVWCEWPNSDGFLVLRPQVLAVMDVGSLCWLNTRVVIRPKGQYTKDDVWGLIGDTLDRYGVFRIAVLEGGTWQSSCVVGHKTGITDSDRVGGLESLGVKIIHTRSPRGKIIEGAFNQLQHAMDNCPGFCGRAEMKDCPEAVRQQLAAVRAGKAHPRQFFLHVHQFSDHLQGVMRALNAERNDGKILRGRSPDQAWAEAAVERPEMPDASKWLYRSAYSVVTVTRNGVRVTVGSGKYQQAYSYYHVALEPHRGRRVICYWNDYDPDTDAVIFSIRDGRPHQLLCAASRVPTLSRFGSDKEALHAEAARKNLAMQLAVSESRSLAPYLQRSAPVTPDVPSSPADEAAAHAIAQARQARADHVAAERQLQRRLDAVPLTDDDISAITSADRPEAGDDISAEDIRSLCSPDP